jgi:hypothetical protein
MSASKTAVNLFFNTGSVAVSCPLPRSSSWAGLCAFSLRSSFSENVHVLRGGRVKALAKARAVAKKNREKAGRLTCRASQFTLERAAAPHHSSTMPLKYNNLGWSDVKVSEVRAHLQCCAL